MKPETFDLLLNSYLKERIADFDNFLYDASGGDHVFQGRRGSMAFAPMPVFCSPVPRTFTEETITTHDDDEEIHSTYSCYPENALLRIDSFDGPINKEQETCKSVAKKLVEMADEFERNHLNTIDGINSSTNLSSPPEGFLPEEWSTLRRIYSDSSSLNVSRIASILVDSFTPRTFQGAITFVSERINNLNLQLAVAMELSAQVVQRLGGGVLDTIRGIIREYFENQTELEDLQTTEGSAS